MRNKRVELYVEALELRKVGSAVPAPLFARGIHLLKHFLHLLVLREHFVDILNLLTAADGNAPFARGIDDVGVFSLFGGHGLNNRLDLVKLTLVNFNVF